MNNHFIARTFTVLDSSGVADVASRVSIAINKQNSHPEGAPFVMRINSGFEIGQPIAGELPGPYSGFVSFKQLPPQPQEENTAVAYYWLHFGKAGPAFEATAEKWINDYGCEPYEGPRIASDGQDIYALQAFLQYTKGPFDAYAHPANVLVVRKPEAFLYRLVLGDNSSNTCKVDELLRNAGWAICGSQGQAVHKGSTVLAMSFIENYAAPYSGYNREHDPEPLSDFRGTPASVIAWDGPSG